MSEQGDDAFKIVATGQKITHSARRHNVLSAVGLDYLAARGLGFDNPNANFPSAIGGQVLVKNTTGSVVDKFNVLGIGGVEIAHSDDADFFETNILISGVAPTVTAHTGLFVVTSEPINSGDIGCGFVPGAYPAQVNMISASDKFADVKDGDSTQLQSGSNGSLQIIYVDSGTGTKWALVRASTSSAGFVCGLITGNATGAGKYTGKSFGALPTGDVSASSDLAEADFGTLSSSNDCLILNPVELGVSTSGHQVTDSANTSQFAIYFVGQLQQINSDGTKVVRAMMFYAAC